MMLKIVPLELRELNSLVEKYHRHHKPVQGHRFSIGVIETKTGEIVGGCSVGRPISRNVNPKEVLEVTRLVTNGTKNACSILYAAAARIGREMGYKKIQTYILDTENGTSLIASGWTCEKRHTAPPFWNIGRKDNVDREVPPFVSKQRWVKILEK